MTDRDDIRRKGVENEVEGTSKDVKGRVKDAVGGLTGGSSQAGVTWVARRTARSWTPAGKSARTATPWPTANST